MPFRSPLLYGLHQLVQLTKLLVCWINQHTSLFFACSGKQRLHGGTKRESIPLILAILPRSSSSPAHVSPSICWA